MVGLVAGGDVAEVVEVQEAPLGVYVGVGASYDNYLLEDNRYGGTVVAGYDYNKYVGVELRASSNFTGNNEVYSGFIKPQYPVLGGSIYGLLGGEVSYVYTNEEVYSYAVGAGVEYTNVRLDTVYNVETEDYKTLVSYVYKF